MQMTTRQLISLIDLTSLDSDDTVAKITALCRDAVTPFGPVAAVCIYPRFVADARATLDGNGGETIAVATVVNFPEGEDALREIAAATRQALADGAREIDLVLPYRALLAGDKTLPLDTVREIALLTHAADGRLKVIIESGTLETQENIARATRIAIEGGADFVKTSTGKSATGATPEAVATICRTLARGNAPPIGIKISGGLRTLDQAQQYLAIIRARFGARWITPQHVRFGASSLLGNITSASSGAAKESGSTS